MQRKRGAGEEGGRGWGTSKTRQDPDASRAGKTPPAYHSMSRGGCQGEWGRGKSGEARVGEMSTNEQKRAEVSKGKCETREGRNGLKKLIRTNPHRAQKRV